MPGQDPPSSYVSLHKIGRNLVVSDVDPSDSVAVEVLHGVAGGGPPARERKQLWLESLAFIATNFICFLGAAHEFPKEMLLFLKTEM